MRSHGSTGTVWQSTAYASWMGMPSLLMKSV